MPGRVLVVTNDFPPVIGGIETFTATLASGLPADRVVVHTRRVPGSDAVDERLPFPVVREDARVLLPTPGLARRLMDTADRYGADRAWFASSAPLGLLAGSLRRGGLTPLVASTHGHEVWWSAVPGASGALRRIAASVDTLTYVSDHTRDRVAPALAPADAARMERLAPGVDPAMFRPDAGHRRRVREGLGLGDEPLVLALARLVPRKGHDVLLAAWPRIRRRHPRAHLVVVGGGPHAAALARRAASAGGRAAGIRLVGPVPWVQTPQWYAAADIFALPTRTRWAGLEPEALGICFLEAAAAGLPVVAGRSGGTAETLRDGDTGYLVDPRAIDAVVAAVSRLLDDPAGSRERGRRGRDWVTQRWSWPAAQSRLRDVLGVPRSDGR